MKHRWLYTVGMLLGMVAFSTAEAATSSGPDYTPPSWDQQLKCPTKANCPRFIVLSNWNKAAVLDKETGLVWEQSPSTDTVTWEDAQTYCNGLTTGNRLGWRLPTLQELASLVDPTVPSPGPTLPAGHPFSNVQSDVYWSATTYASGTVSAWAVSFLGGVISFGKTSTFYVWCVRGGQGVDPQ